MATNKAGATVISAPHSRPSQTALRALDELAAKSRQCWDATSNPDGWATAPTEVAVRSKRTMNELVRAGLARRRLREPLGVYQYRLTEAGRKLANGVSERKEAQ